MPPVPVAQAASRQHRWLVTIPAVPHRRAWLGPTLAWSAVVAAAIALGIYAHPARLMVPPGAGRSLPRIPPPPPDLPTLLDALGVGSFVWYAAACALPVLLWMARRAGGERHGRLRTMAAAAAIVAGSTSMSTIAQYYATYGGTTNRPGLGSFLPSVLASHLLAWTALIGVVAAVEWRRRAQLAALEHERLRAQVAEQRLIALTGQLQPHFLFNTLQGISTLIHRDGNAADDMLAKLSDLLRELLRHRESALVPLGDEVRYARTYLEIAQLRFAGRLAFEIDVRPDLSEAAVPLFILQPLVENALAHGIGGRIEGGTVTIRARRSADRLRLEVMDDGAGISASGPASEGIGLGNTRERLRAAFGVEQRLSIEAAPEGGTLAVIDVPFRHCEPAAGVA